jgi:hypothetical protein
MRRQLARRATVPPKRYGSLASFYRADARRIESRELDIGLWWREGESGCLHRAAWVSDTGELYLVRLGPESDGGGGVEILATVRDKDRLEMILEGWRERCGEPGSLAWLRERAGRLSSRARVAQVRVGPGASGRGPRLAPISGFS